MYEKTIWKDNETPLDAENLNKIENEVNRLSTYSMPIYTKGEQLGFTKGQKVNIIQLTSKLPEGSIWYSTLVDAGINIINNMPREAGVCCLLEIIKFTQFRRIIRLTTAYGSVNAYPMRMWFGDFNGGSADNIRWREIPCYEDLSKCIKVNTDWIDLNQEANLLNTDKITVQVAKIKVINGIAYLYVQIALKQGYTGDNIYDLGFLQNIPYVPEIQNQRFFVGVDGNCMVIDTPNNIESTLKISTFTKDYSANRRVYTLNVNYPIRQGFSLPNTNTTNATNVITSTMEDVELELDTESIENTELE